MGRVLAWVGIGVLALIGLVVAALFVFDSAIRDAAEARTAEDLRVSVPFTTTPEVQIEGYPLAWYAAINRYPEVRVAGDEMPVAVDASRTVALRDVTFTLNDVSLTDAEVRAASLDGEGLLDYAELSRLAGFGVSHAGGDRLAASGSVQVFGVTATGSVTGSIALDQQAQTLSLSDPEVEIVGIRLPQAASDALVATAARPIAVPLPYGLELDAVAPVPEGVVAGVTGRDVVIPRR